MHHDKAGWAHNLFVTQKKMPYVRYCVLEDGGVGWWGFCFDTFSEQVSGVVLAASAEE